MVMAPGEGWPPWDFPGARGCGARHGCCRCRSPAQRRCIPLDGATLLRAWRVVFALARGCCERGKKGRRGPACPRGGPRSKMVDLPVAGEDGHQRPANSETAAARRRPGVVAPGRWRCAEVMAWPCSKRMNGAARRVRISSTDRQRRHGRAASGKEEEARHGSGGMSSQRKRDTRAGARRG
jgi:hypothetical protein